MDFEALCLLSQILVDAICVENTAVSCISTGVQPGSQALRIEGEGMNLQSSMVKYEFLRDPINVSCKPNNGQHSRSSDIGPFR